MRDWSLLCLVYYQLESTKVVTIHSVTKTLTRTGHSTTIACESERKDILSGRFVMQLLYCFVPIIVASEDFEHRIYCLWASAMVLYVERRYFLLSFHLGYDLICKTFQILRIRYIESLQYKNTAFAAARLHQNSS